MAAGEEIITYCGSCKLELRHVIVAHKHGNSGPIAKVRCNTCGSIHGYRGKPEEKTIAARRAGTGAPREKARIIPLEVEWREELRSREAQPSIPYTPQREFKVGDIFDHPTFGCGVVRSIKDGNKFEALFQHDIKVLVHKLKQE
jgi:hypothetical protein